MEGNQKDYMEIDLMRLLKALLHKAWLIILAAAVAGMIAFAYVSLLVTPLHKASALMYVNNNAVSLSNVVTSFSSAQISAAKSLVDTYTVILKTRTTLNTVIERSGVNYTYSQLASMIDTGSVNGTEIFSITVTCPDPNDAELLANTIATVLPEKIANIVDGSSVKVVDFAVVPSVKSSPSVTKYTGIGIMIGIVLSCGVIVVMELMDNLVHDEEYLLQTYKLPVLAAIPDLEESQSYTGYYNKSKSGGK